MSNQFRVLFVASLICFGAGAAFAQQPSSEKPADKASDKASEKPKDEKKAPEDKAVVTKHSVRIGGQEVR